MGEEPVSDTNDQLRRARERTESPNSTGQPLSRQELAELVNAWVFEHKNRTVELDVNYVGKLEQGAIRWPRDDDRRAGLRAVLGANTDAELGFGVPGAPALCWPVWIVMTSSAPPWARARAPRWPGSWS